jgi:hypothetical protein
MFSGSKQVMTTLPFHSHLARCALGLQTLLAVTCLLGGAGCAEDGDASDHENDGPKDALLAAPPRGSGVQYAMSTTIAPGQEAEHCKFVRAPSEGMLVQRDEIRFTAGSHHVLVYETAYDEIPTRKQDGTVVDTSDVFDCSDGATDGWDVTKLIGGSQNGSGESLLSFPEGIAVRVRPNTVLMLNVHYINVATEPIEPEVRVNLYTISEDELVEEGDLLFLYNMLIQIDPGSESRARMRCPVHRDITIVNVQSHMHRRGVGFAAMIEGDEPFYENDQWEDVPVKHFEPGLTVSAGQRLDYYCDYENNDDHAIVQGPRSTDEMCMLIGSYYPADARTSNCEDEAGDLASEWVGAGSASCPDTLTCVSEAGADFGAASQCMLAADPDFAQVTSAVVLCSMQAENPLQDCAAELAACLQQ